MRYRKLRIAWSVFCGIACVLLVVLWVRSYWKHDRIFGHTSVSGVLEIQSIHGQLVWIDGSEPNANTNVGTGWHIASDPIETPRLRRFLLAGFTTQQYPNVIEIEIPYWFLLLVAVSLGTAPWLHWRFSLRTLLIATTLIAVLLGLAVYWTRL